MNRRFPPLMLSLCLMFGCSSDSEKGQSEYDGPGGVDKGEKPISVDLSRDSMAGRWQLIFYAGQSPQALPAPVPFALIEVLQQDGTFAARVEETAPNGPQVTIASSEIEDGKVHLVMEAGGTTMDFVGSGDATQVRGNIEFDKMMSVAAEMLATDSLTLPDPPPLAGVDSFEEAISERDQIAGYRKFASQHRDSPLALEALERALSDPKIAELPPTEVEAIIDEYLTTALGWGERLRQSSKLNVGMSLIEAQAHLDLASQSITELMQPDSSQTEESATAETPNRLELIAETALKRISILENQLMVQSDDPEKQAEGVAGIRELLEENPFDSDMLYTLAVYSRDHDQPEDAIEFFGRLVAIPELQRELFQNWNMAGEKRDLPIEELSRLWEAKHNHTDHLAKFLDEVYRQQIHRFVPEDFAAPTETNRPVLLELFTGALCPPCVAADVATGAIEANYPSTDVLALRYHQHIPGPDPLTNPDAEARFTYYAGQGTPSLYVDGTKVDAGGPLVYAAPTFANIAKQVNEALSAEPPVKVDLMVSIEEGTLSINARVPDTSGLPERARLRLVVAEHEIVFAAPNGIRIHEMVVRSMPGGASGVGVEDGTLQTDQQLDLTKLRSDLKAYLLEYESGRQFTFPIRPLDLSELEVVALVQDDATREVLGYARTNVQGIPPVADEPPTKGEPTDATSEDPEPAPNANPEEEATGDRSTNATTPPDSKESEPAPADELKKRQQGQPGTEEDPKAEQSSDPSKTTDDSARE